MKQIAMFGEMQTVHHQRVAPVPVPCPGVTVENPLNARKRHVKCTNAKPDGESLCAYCAGLRNVVKAGK